MNIYEIFHGRKLIIATKHQKEQVIAPLIEKALGVHCFVDPLLDTDLLGTFSGEIERIDDPIDSARKKCLMAMEQTNCDLAIASEGSFGPHPTLFFVPANEEFILLLDKKTGLEIIARELSTMTNFNAAEITSEEALLSFAQQAKFPTHALILKNDQEHFTDIEKGITDIDRLLGTFRHFSHTYGKVYVETDMRAMYNPTRMSMIEKATIHLIQKLNKVCPACMAPGFDVHEVKSGLPCQQCHMPTRSALSYQYQCQQCKYTEEKKYPHEKQTENPMYCDFCNP